MSELDDELVLEAARELRRPVRIDPALDGRVMAEVEALARGGLEGAGTLRAPQRGRLAAAWDWLRRPRSVSVSPLGAVAAVAVLGALFVGVVRPSALGPRPSAVVAEPTSRRADGPTGSTEGRGPRGESPVHFVLVAPGASTVAVVGDFNDWDSTATRLRPATAGGVWAVTVPLAPGRHRYAFIVDGREWRPDPSAPRARDDDFGVPSSVVTVAERRS